MGDLEVPFTYATSLCSLHQQFHFALVKEIVRKNTSVYLHPQSVVFVSFFVKEDFIEISSVLHRVDTKPNNPFRLTVNTNPRSVWGRGWLMNLYNLFQVFKRGFALLLTMIQFKFEKSSLFFWSHFVLYCSDSYSIDPHGHPKEVQKATAFTPALQTVMQDQPGDWLDTLNVCDGLVCSMHA